MFVLPLYDEEPPRRLPVATYGLIAACAGVFLWQASLPAGAANAVAYRWGMVPAVLFGMADLPARLHAAPAIVTPVTAMFLHGGWIHLLGNMLYLWLFGRGAEDRLGTLRFLGLYFACGLVASLAQAVMDPFSKVPMIGASGAIAGVLGAFIVLRPRARIVVFVWIIIFFRLIAVPAAVLLGLWFLFQVMGALDAAPDEPGVAFWAHVGGFVAGMVLVLRARRRRSIASVPPSGRVLRRSWF